MRRCSVGHESSANHYKIPLPLHCFGDMNLNSDRVIVLVTFLFLAHYGIQSLTAQRSVLRLWPDSL